ncbi:hypothetical protein AB5I41_13975 [Sphingomonas sp. MMS24-JH45]
MKESIVARWPTGAKLFLILSIALLPLALIAIFATLRVTQIADTEVRSHLRISRGGGGRRRDRAGRRHDRAAGRRGRARHRRGRRAQLRAGPRACSRSNRRRARASSSSTAAAAPCAASPTPAPPPSRASRRRRRSAPASSKGAA